MDEALPPRCLPGRLQQLNVLLALCPVVSLAAATFVSGSLFLATIFSGHLLVEEVSLTCSKGPFSEVCS